MPDYTILVLFIALSLIAEIIGTVGGFGSSVFFVPMALYFFDFYSVLGITAVFHLSSNLSKIALFKKGFDKKLILWMGIPSVICVIAGSMLTAYIDSYWLELCLNVFLLLLAALLLIWPRIQVPKKNGYALGGGILSGFLAGLVGTGGAIRGLTLAAFNLPKEVFVATSAIIDMAIDLSRSGVYITSGYLHTHDLYLIPILIVVSFIGTWLGKLILLRVPQQKFRLISLLFILLVACVGLFRVFSN